MANGDSSADIDVMVSPAVPEIGRAQVREQVTVRRRRARTGHHGSRSTGRWVAASRSRRRAVRTFAVSAGVLLLMAIGLYFSLSRQDNARPAEGAVHVGALGAFGAA